MMRGRITAADQAVLDLAVFGPTGRHETFRVVIDTGFNGHLTLPSDVVAHLDLRFHSMAVASVAGATSLATRRFHGEVMWDGRPKEAFVLEAEGMPLLGMAMLRGYRVTFDALLDGAVTMVAIAESG